MKGVSGMVSDKARFRVLLALCSTGLLISILSGLYDKLPVLQALCGSVSDGCSDTAGVGLFGVPLWLWGALFYVLALLILWRFPEWMVFPAAGAFGIEAALAWIMIAMQALCVFCVANFFVVLLLVIFSFRKSFLWQMLSVSLLFFILAVFLLPQQNKGLSFGAPGGRHDIAARLGSQIVTEERLAQMIGHRLFELEKEIYRLKRDRLEQMIVDRVLQEEANARGIPLEQLLNEEVLPNVTPVTDEEVDDYYLANRAKLKDWKGSMEDLKVRIRGFLEQERRLNGLVKYARTLEPKYGVVVYLEEPRIPLMDVRIDGNYSTGRSNALVTVVEFSDYQCPVCRSVHTVARRLKDHYREQVRWVFKDYPLRKHRNSRMTAEAARCAGEQGKFWEYQDILFSSREEFNPESLERFAVDLGLSGELFQECLSSGKFGEAVQKDLQEAERLGLDRTPSFIVNGRLMTGGLSFEQFEEVINEELGKAKDKSR